MARKKNLKNIDCVGIKFTGILELKKIKNDYNKKFNSDFIELRFENDEYYGVIKLYKKISCGILYNELENYRIGQEFKCNYNSWNGLFIANSSMKFDKMAYGLLTEKEKKFLNLKECMFK